MCYQVTDVGVPDFNARLQRVAEGGQWQYARRVGLRLLKQLNHHPDGKTDRENGDADGGEICDIRH